MNCGNCCLVKNSISLKSKMKRFAISRFEQSVFSISRSNCNSHKSPPTTFSISYCLSSSIESKATAIIIIERTHTNNAEREKEKKIEAKNSLRRFMKLLLRRRRRWHRSKAFSVFLECVVDAMQLNSSAWNFCAHSLFVHRICEM